MTSSSRSASEHAWYAPEAGEINRIAFNGCADPTLGIEVEYQIIDPDSGELAPGGPAILETFDQPAYAKPELLQSTVELNVGPCKDVGEARSALKRRLAALRGVANDLGYDLIAAGTHPSSAWEAQRITENERYQSLLDRMQWPARRLMIFGVHVHVGVSSGEKAIAISNSLTTFLPHLLALSASSPFWHGEDTGLASVRVKIFESLPAAGLPYRMINWGEFQRFMNTLINAGAIESIREIWWDVRPHPIFGTIEVRIADALPTVRETIALAALIQSLVVRLGELYDCGEFLPLNRHWIVAENKWRAARYADRAEVIADDSGELRRLDEMVREMVANLEPVAKRLGCHDELLDNLAILDARPAFQRLRDVHEESGSMREVVRYLQRQMETDAPF
jgi:carboxylate-amine ligase